MWNSCRFLFSIHTTRHIFPSHTHTHIRFIMVIFTFLLFFFLHSIFVLQPLNSSSLIHFRTQSEIILIAWWFYIAVIYLKRANNACKILLDAIFFGLHIISNTSTYQCWKATKKNFVINLPELSLNSQCLA